jgi:hypothetical protein
MDLHDKDVLQTAFYYSSILKRESADFCEMTVQFCKPGVPHIRNIRILTFTPVRISNLSQVIENVTYMT